MVANYEFSGDLNNNLFRAYSDFLNLDENKIKKRVILKHINSRNSVLKKLSIDK